jgi:hypothetical protein
MLRFCPAVTARVMTAAIATTIAKITMTTAISTRVKPRDERIKIERTP